jgi:two-component sensor histidine kinase
VALPPHPTSPRAARRLIEQRLADADAEKARAAALVASELVTNAIVHARTDVSLRLSRTDPRLLRIAVCDDSPTLPVARSVALDAESGRGLRIIEAIASQWGAQPAGRGKVVWAEIPL